MFTKILIPLLFISAALYSCNTKEESDSSNKKVITMKLTSTAFQDGAFIPDTFTCKGANISPPLLWSGMPAGTKSFAVTCEDPDALVGVWIHWVMYNIPPDKTGLDQQVVPKQTLPDGSVQGTNDFGDIGYSGPCPPKDTPHRYYFKVYALDTTFNLTGKVTKQVLDEKMTDHIIGQGQLIGKYERK
jgi:Raf kinase inhibitor-like YbhB/YbcL family protein